MSLYKDWQNLIDGQTKQTFDDFWKEYSETETRIYSGLLDKANDEGADNKVNFAGGFKELAEKYDADSVIFMGFLDGITESIDETLDLDSMDESSDISITVILEKLLFNMLKADAQYLYSLPQWEEIFGEEKITEIVTAYRKSRTVVKEKKPGRNDPCPCGSGKKYKHCCGKTA